MASGPLFGPGSTSAVYDDNLSPDHCWRPKTRLLRRKTNPADEMISVALFWLPANHLGMTMKWLACSFLLVAVSPHTALGFDPVRVDQVKYTKACPKCDLSEADLIGEDLRGANLEGAIMTGVDLEEADLRRANLKRVDLSLSFFWGSNSEIGLRASAGGANLKGANLQGADLEQANLTGADLEGANLSEANLSGANLQSANLTGTNLENAELHQANLCHTIMPDGTQSTAGCAD
ncbi:MAG: pentapeptide repeat-containing protein [Candidatus Promineifilaceae bacterium]